MKPFVVPAFVALVCMSGIAQADCTSAVLDAPTLSTVFAEKTVCGRPGASYPGQGGASSADRWQEYHNPSGALVDFKRGAADPVDPSKTVGSWSIDAQANKLVHQYTGGSTFSWNVRGTVGGPYSFCTDAGAEHVVALVQAGSTGCGSYP